MLNTNNYGCFSSKTLDNQITKAEAAPLSQSAALWHAADVTVMQNAVIVPLIEQQAPFYTSARVQNAGATAVTYAPNIGGPDITNLWLNPNKP